METPQPEQAPKSNRNIIIAVIVLLVLCCCLLALGAGGYYGYQKFAAAQAAITDYQNLGAPTSIPGSPTDSNTPGDPQIPGFDVSSAPSGGLADDNTRYSAWLALQVVAMISDCPTPTAKGTSIKVVDQPNAQGEWKESWDVDCGNGSTKPYNVTFTPENGVVNVNVELPK